MKRLMLVAGLLAILMLFAVGASAQQAEQGLLYSTGSGGVTITGYTSHVTELEVPSSIGGLPVTAIGNEAFSDSGLVRVVLPEGITSIGRGAFKNNLQLREISLPSSLRTIGESAFSSCSQLERIVIPDRVEEIPSSAFMRCLNLKEVVFPRNLRTIGDYAFAVTGMTALELPYGLETVGTYAFYGNMGLTRVTLPNSIKRMENFAFFVCDNLTDIVMPTGMSVLASGVLDKCPNLQTVAIPRTVRQVRDDALHMGHLKAPNARVLGVPGSEAEGFAKRIRYPFEAVAETQSVQILVNGQPFSGDKLGIDLASNVRSVQLEVVTSPETLWPGVEWSSSSGKAASVDIYGLVSGQGKGETTITATAIDGSGARDSLVFNIANLAKAIDIEGASELPAKSRTTLKAIVLPETTDNKKVVWTVSDDSLAKISNRGVVTATNVEKRENITVTASATDGSGVVGTKQMTINPLVASVGLSVGDMVLEKKQTLSIDLSSDQHTLQLTANVLPLDAIQAVTWKSNAARVVSVSEDGLATGLRKGRATITATSTDGTRKSFTTTIQVANLSKSVSIEGPQQVATGGKVTLKAIVLPETSDNRKVEWSSSDETIARVNRSGVVSARKLDEIREVTITAKAADGSGAEAQYLISVVPEAVAVQLLLDGAVVEPKEPITIDLAAGEQSIQLLAQVIPAEAGQLVTWRSNAKHIVAVDENGVLTPVRRGKATITATAEDGTRKRASCVVTVIDSSR